MYISLASHLSVSCYQVNMSLVIDFEGFQVSSKQFFVKELAAYAVNDSTFRGRWLFKAPFCFDHLDKKSKITVLYTAYNIHHMDWTEGHLPYTDLPCILRMLFRSFKKIYVKGLQKKKFLERFGVEIENLEDENCPRFCQLPPVETRCPYWHIKGFSHCAVQKAEAYAKFLESL